LSKSSTRRIDRGYQWGDEIPIGLFWRRTDLPTLEKQEPVLHTGEGPLAYRTNIGIPSDRAKALYSVDRKVDTNLLCQRS
jgi:2-oxoglutarate ferredoxin oxidoreductase subunit beta